MAENINDDKYWVRNISDDGTYLYYNLSEDEIPTFLKNQPNAQGMMRDEKGEMMPYALKNIDKVKSMENITLHDIDEKNIEAYDQYEQKFIRNYRSNFEAFDNVMDDWGIQTGTPLHTLLATTMAKETGYGYHGVSNIYGARGLMQITGLTFKDLKQRFGDQYQYVCDKYNDGNPISHDDLTKPEFAEASIALGVVVMKDKLRAAKEKEGI